jgi:predicted membrane channel-forming protein YqfA (hemolysin III family)
MATDAPLPEKMAEKNPSEVPTMAIVAAIAAWAVPGLGHLLLRRWARAIFLFLAVSALALAGYAMRGELFTMQSSDPFGLLGFLADACSGIFYFLPRLLEATGPDVSRAAGDYGTRFLAAAGVVNVLGMIDAYRIACGRKK